MDDFFTKTLCDRCHKPFGGTRIMSMYNTDCICMVCKEAETKRADYKLAQDADMKEIRNGNYNYQGIGYKEEIT
ncbi:MAG: gamma-glutamylcyclotransferase [Alphaproteobacteria bacterium]|nr:gamma-glutamylcyclotransferase [Clostridia bacterium]MBQ7673588.1 gamma-glutamylcyclotransferase [Alphaproteobacteria bacterium]